MLLSLRDHTVWSQDQEYSKSIKIPRIESEFQERHSCHGSKEGKSDIQKVASEVSFKNCLLLLQPQFGLKAVPY